MNEYADIDRALKLSEEESQYSDAVALLRKCCNRVSEQTGLFCFLTLGGTCRFAVCLSLKREDPHSQRLFSFSVEKEGVKFSHDGSSKLTTFDPNEVVPAFASMLREREIAQVVQMMRGLSI